MPAELSITQRPSCAVLRCVCVQYYSSNTNKLIAPIRASAASCDGAKDRWDSAVSFEVPQTWGLS